MNLLVKYGTNRIGRYYVITAVNKEIVINMLKYFTGNEGYDMNKGIYLFGPYGVGKTTLFETIKSVLGNIIIVDENKNRQSANGFISASIEQIIEHYKREGNIDKFGFCERKANLCIHEFGKRINERIYGTDANSVIESLLMIRYELYQNGYLTHVTGNYHPNDVSMPDIIKDRMIEMFNFIEFKGESLRK